MSAGGKPFPDGVVRDAWKQGLGTWEIDPGFRKRFVGRVTSRITETLGATPIIQHRRISWATQEGWLRKARLTLRKDKRGTADKRPHYRWKISLCDRRFRGGSRPRGHPNFWFIACPTYKAHSPGHILVIPDCVIPVHWTTIHLAQRSYWVWHFWERWDCLLTYPDIPDDLLGE